MKRLEPEFEADLRLVERCLKGDSSAWREMYDEFQPKLLLSVRAQIGNNGSGANLADEITARVWLSLIADDSIVLDRYDPHRGSRLATFLSSVARHELLKHWRGERRRENRERMALINRPRRLVDGIDHTQVYWHEFLNTLTNREREFVQKVLIAPPEETTNEEFTQANTWQLRRRVMSKLKLYFARESTVAK
jgi:DNA-directed RNA polymerase specialized sigma24 family protein